MVAWAAARRAVQGVLRAGTGRQGPLPGEWFSDGAFPELRLLVISNVPLGVPFRSPSLGSITGQLPDITNGALPSLQVRCQRRQGRSHWTDVHATSVSCACGKSRQTRLVARAVCSAAAASPANDRAFTCKRRSAEPAGEAHMGLSSGGTESGVLSGPVNGLLACKRCSRSKPIVHCWRWQL